MLSGGMLRVRACFMLATWTNFSSQRERERDRERERKREREREREREKEIDR